MHMAGRHLHAEPRGVVCFDDPGTFYVGMINGVDHVRSMGVTPHGQSTSYIVLLLVRTFVFCSLNTAL